MLVKYHMVLNTLNNSKAKLNLFFSLSNYEIWALNHKITIKNIFKNLIKI